MNIKDWFKRTPEAKTSAAGSIIAYTQAGSPRWTPRRYDALADEGFAKNVIAWRCITEVARACASIPFTLYDDHGDEITSHPLLDLLLQPNPLASGHQFIEHTVCQFQIAGNAYIEAVGAEDVEGPSELYVLRADRMKVIPGSSGLPLGYEYAVNGKTSRWAADPITGHSPILHWKNFHPLNDWYGMSPMEAALPAIDQHNAAGAWNQSLLQHGARPSGALLYAAKDGPSHLSDEQFRRLKEELDENYTNARNAGRPLVLEGGLEWKEMGLSPKDMDWMAGRDRAAIDIALAFGVPEQLIGIAGAQTFANMAEARLALYEDTVIPLMIQLTGELNRWLTPMFADDLRLDIDRDEILALTARRDQVWDKVGRAEFLTINEKRSALGYPPIDGGDVLPPTKNQ